MAEQQQSDPKETRLDRLEAIVEANSQQIEKNTNAIIDLRVAVSSLIETANQFQRNFEVIVSEIRDIKSEMREMRSEMRQMQSEIVALRQDFTVVHSEIRGLQMENRRILDHLFNRQGNGETEN